MSGRGSGDLSTLEPLLECVREGVEQSGWTLSGLQKTTSYQFEGRWEGDSTRSAYLFFHQETRPEEVSIDVYLDETSRGLTGNLALVVDLLPLAELGDVEEALRVLSALSTAAFPDPRVTPLTLRLRLPDSADPAGTAETEARFKVQISKQDVLEGADAVRRMCTSAVAGFERLLASPELSRYLVDE